MVSVPRPDQVTGHGLPLPAVQAGDDAEPAWQAAARHQLAAGEATGLPLGMRQDHPATRGHGRPLAARERLA
jgi:hypothetical protein